MAKTIWFLLFSASLAGLILVLARGRIGWRWLGAIALNLALAGILLYFINLAAPYTHFRLPINMMTLTTVAALGLPGLALLAAVKWLFVR
mgnify:CR=1 FL=1